LCDQSLRLAGRFADQPDGDEGQDEHAHEHHGDQGGLGQHHDDDEAYGTHHEVTDTGHKIREAPPNAFGGFGQVFFGGHVFSHGNLLSGSPMMGPYPASV
jgi:hypothetical protein